MDLLYEPEKQILRVHEKWLNFEDIHSTASCYLYRSATNQSITPETLFCDHIIEEIYAMALSDVMKDVDLRQNHAILVKRFLQNEVHDKLQQIPRGVNVNPTDNGGELEVLWLSNESPLVSKLLLDTKVHITLHRENTCFRERSNVLHGQGGCYFNVLLKTRLVFCDCMWQIGLINGYIQIHNGYHRRVMRDGVCLVKAQPSVAATNVSCL